MAENEKLTILHLMDLLLDRTDRDHTMTADMICTTLENDYEIVCSRKTVYRDITRLREYGLKIGQLRGSTPGYYVDERDFELAELKLLVDAVQSSKFITEEKSRELIRKLGRLTSRENSKQLQRQVYIINRPKTGNDAIYQNVDTIHEAIRENRQVTFHYLEWTMKKELQQKHDGQLYHVSPWSLTWDDENYYLVGFDEETKQIKHYRVDKMEDISLTHDKRNGCEQFRDFDLAAFAKKTFGMYGGTDTKVTLCCEENIAGVILDRFGKDIMMFPRDNHTFRVTVLVTVSPQFFGWITGIGAGIRIDGPEEVQEEYREYLRKIMNLYEDSQDP